MISTISCGWVISPPTTTLKGSSILTAKEVDIAICKPNWKKKKLKEKLSFDGNPNSKGAHCVESRPNALTIRCEEIKPRGLFSLRINHIIIMCYQGNWVLDFYRAFKCYYCSFPLKYWAQGTSFVYNKWSSEKKKRTVVLLLQLFFCKKLCWTRKTVPCGHK